MHLSFLSRYSQAVRLPPQDSERGEEDEWRITPHCWQFHFIVKQFLNFRSHPF